jgi:DNA-binding transcriptional LysR family regulator
VQIQHVAYFLAVAEEGSFTLAAQACSVKQPSLSKAIQDLESHYGAVLFLRSEGRRGASLTELGRTMRPHFLRIARSIAAAERQAAVYRAALELDRAG